jgi:serine/threonine kinase 32
MSLLTLFSCPMSQIMKMLGGGDLQYHISQLKKAKSEFSEDAIRFFSASLIYGLDHLHDRLVIHRDIKVLRDPLFLLSLFSSLTHTPSLSLSLFPQNSNLLLDEAGHLYITDFGVSTILKQGMTAVGRAGTLLYMAPEVLLGESYNEKVSFSPLRSPADDPFRHTV